IHHNTLLFDDCSNDDDDDEDQELLKASLLLTDNKLNQREESNWNLQAKKVRSDEFYTSGEESLPHTSAMFDCSISDSDSLRPTETTAAKNISIDKLDKSRDISKDDFQIDVTEFSQKHVNTDLIDDALDSPFNIEDPHTPASDYELHIDSKSPDPKQVKDPRLELLKPIMATQKVKRPVKGGMLGSYLKESSEIPFTHMLQSSVPATHSKNGGSLFKVLDLKGTSTFVLFSVVELMNNEQEFKVYVHREYLPAFDPFMSLRNLCMHLHYPVYELGIVNGQTTLIASSVSFR
ncbi:MAG: hypothetical protein MHMPM18_002672, partial [Marteilia pararefringens]